MNPVTICTSFNLTEAQLVCSRLEAANFHPFIPNECIASWFGNFGGLGFSTATLICVQVPEPESADAKEFLATPATPAE